MVVRFGSLLRDCLSAIFGPVMYNIPYGPFEVHMTKSHFRSQNDQYLYSIDHRYGGNTPRPYQGFGGFSRNKTSISKRSIFSRFIDEDGHSGDALTPHPLPGDQLSGYDDSFVDLPSFPPELGFGVDLQLRADIAQTDFSALITAMEMKSTIEGIGSLARRLGDAYGALRHGDLRGFTRSLDVSSSTPAPKAKKVMDNASSYLLEYQFGIVSLYNDMLGLATTIYDQSQFPASMRFKASEKQKIDGVCFSTASTISCEWTDGSHLHSPVQRAGRYAGTALYKAVTDVVVSSPLEFYLSQFGFTNPAHAVYSVLPNSWLFDAFVPLGDFLSQLYLPPGIALANSGVIKLLDTTLDFDPVIESDVGYYPYVYKTPDGVANGNIMESRYSNRLSGTIFTLEMSGADFNSTSFQVKPKLPFLGQAITSSAYAHQRSGDLKNLLSRNSRS